MNAVGKVNRIKIGVVAWVKIAHTEDPSSTIHAQSVKQFKRSSSCRLVVPFPYVTYVFYSSP